MCGIAGVFGVVDAARMVSLMLKALQHRGQQAAGIVSSHGGRFYERRGLGLADEVFNRTDFSNDLPGTMAIGHLRYPTSGGVDSLAAIQPLVASTLRHGQFALVHNGNLTNDLGLREELDRVGTIFRSASDSETILHLLARCFGDDWHKRLLQVFTQVEGAYALLVMTNDRLYIVVDPAGFRPLTMARLGTGYLFASETCAFDLFPEVSEVMRVEPGHLVEVSAEGVFQHPFGHATFRRQCSFEHIYFSRPDSMVFGVSVDEVRQRLGRLLARKNRTTTDCVIAVPDSSNAMALAYAQESGIPYAHGLIRNHYSGRTFITPGQPARELGVRMKLNPVRSVIDGKRVTVVDDSLVRGTTGRKVVGLLRGAGAREVHLRIGSPPVISSCHWGIDTPQRQDLIAAQSSLEEMRQFMGADSLLYLTTEELREALEDPNGDLYCTSCFTGEKPLPGDLIPPEHLLRHPRV